MMSLAAALVLLALAPSTPTAVARVPVPPHGVGIRQADMRSSRPCDSRDRRGSTWTCPPSPSFSVACGNPTTNVQVVIVNGTVIGDVVIVQAPVSTRRGGETTAWATHRPTTNEASTRRVLASR